MTATKRRMRLYLASPLFNDRERTFNDSLRDQLTPDFDVFVPQIDGFLLAKLVAQGTDKDTAERIVYEADISAITTTDIVVAVLDGANVDEGVAFELGYSKALGKTCVGLQTDIRRQLPTGNNPMINRSCIEIFNDVGRLCSWLRRL
ncbi:Nucleoside 2-deoxyribosyltransferase [Nitrosospira sp. Nsp18]|uniref:nucleoside 2-deoxyribosyltransferase n=1 Tax=Nitrosospira sp. Nsp18 TaxID=1855334 RepID=UPI000880EF1F|nr:nucleoside 2-deoxyribosyltransferase [Nitrosospira sp. Nsp18]SDA16722.1 Nucleoside 2-deoxyribosyltransferase [Nitrosospira sp. Nsp18]